MKRPSLLFILALSTLSAKLTAQYGMQFDNRGFEQWTERQEASVAEPVHWHSGGTASGTFSGFLSNQIEASNHSRPGSTGTKSVRIFPTSILGITANGNLTNGRMNAGSMSATGSDNYNYTQRSESAFNTPINTIPDSISVWVCFRSENSTTKALLRSAVHGNDDYRFMANGNDGPAQMLVASTRLAFTRTSPTQTDYVWTRLSLPFVKDGPCNDPRYILFSLATNETPGEGSTNDELLIDDILLIYNPTLRMAQLDKTFFQAGEAINVAFSLTGTMSPDNLNATQNVVIAQLSDATGNFSNPIELGRVSTNTSGHISATLPQVGSGDHYHVRVVSTNYPMIGDNIQEISIANTTDIVEKSARSKVYPNPVTSSLQIMAEKAVQSIKIYDMTGRLVHEQSAARSNPTVDLGQIEPGVYMLQLDFGTETATHRIVKP